MKRKTAWAAMLAAGAALLGGGCFSVDVGPREWYSKEYFSGEEAGRTVSVACTSVEPSVDARQLSKGRIGIGLKGEVETRREKEKVYKRLTIERQRKLDFGLLPAWRETFDFAGIRLDGNDDGSMVSMAGADFNPDTKAYENRGGYGLVWTGGTFLGMILMTPYATLVEPFAGDWSCSTHHWVLPGTTANRDAFLHWYADETGDRLQSLEIAAPVFEALGVRTWHDGPGSQDEFTSQFTHSALFGFHKRSKVYVRPPATTRREAVEGHETRTDTHVAVGPFRVWLGIPALGWSDSADVPRGRGQAWFDLPEGAGPGTELEIRFGPAQEEPAESTKRLLEAAGAAACRHSL